LFFTSRAPSQQIVPGLRPRAVHPNDEARSRLVGLLTYTRLNVHFEDVAARDAFTRIGQALNITLIGRYEDDKVGHGIDPTLPVTIHADGRFALDVLEEVLEQCEVHEDCTWQVRTGMLEVGTKRRLAVPAACERRMYDLTDLLMDPGYFVSPIAEAMDWLPCDSPYVDAVLGEKSREALRNGDPPPPKSKSDLMLEFVEGMVETIEPGHWDLGGTRDASPEADAARRAPFVRHPDEWASVRPYREGLMITAPDFMHRQIAGGGRTIKPDDADVVRDVPPATGTNAGVTLHPKAATHADSGDPDAGG
jgi:hypothetical protein